MEIKSKLPDLSKHMPDKLSADVFRLNVMAAMCVHVMGTEEGQRTLYESLKKKYEGTSKET